MQNNQSTNFLLKIKDGPKPDLKLVCSGWDDVTAESKYHLVHWDPFASRVDNSTIGAWLIRASGGEDWAKRTAKHHKLDIEYLDGYLRTK